MFLFVISDVYSQKVKEIGMSLMGPPYIWGTSVTLFPPIGIDYINNLNFLFIRLVSNYNGLRILEIRKNIGYCCI